MVGLERRRLGQSAIMVPVIGFGAASLGNLYREVSDADARAAIDHAHATGLRYVDTAPFYGFGLSERRVGDALRAYPRESFILSTKVGRLLDADPGVSDARGTSRFLLADAVPAPLRLFI
jgi:D-threo-aldose 1-dehydrogenase